MLEIAEAPVDAPNLAGLLALIADGTISGRIAKEVFEAMWQSGKDAAQIVVSVAPDGSAVIVDLLVDGEPILD